MARKSRRAITSEAQTRPQNPLCSNDLEHKKIVVEPDFFEVRKGDEGRGQEADELVVVDP